MVIMNDRTTQGFFAGVAGAIPEMVFTLTIYSFHLIRFRYLDFASTAVFNHLPKGLFESILTEVFVWIFCGFLGVAFSLLVKIISNENLIIKGSLLGIFAWFMIYSLVTCFKIKPLFPLDTLTSSFHLVGGLIWGASMACMFSFFNKRCGLKN